jgi:hypothetical protein
VSPSSEAWPQGSQVRPENESVGSSRPPPQPRDRRFVDDLDLVIVDLSTI